MQKKNKKKNKKKKKKKKKNKKKNKKKKKKNQWKIKRINEKNINWFFLLFKLLLLVTLTTTTTTNKCLLVPLLPLLSWMPRKDSPFANGVDPSTLSTKRTVMLKSTLSTRTKRAVRFPRLACVATATSGFTTTASLFVPVAPMATAVQRCAMRATTTTWMCLKCVLAANTAAVIEKSKSWRYAADRCESPSICGNPIR